MAALRAHWTIRVAVLVLAVLILGPIGLYSAAVIQEAWQNWKKRNTPPIVQKAIDKRELDPATGLPRGFTRYLPPPDRILGPATASPVAEKDLPDLDKETPGEIRPPLDLETRFEAAFGPRGKRDPDVEARADTGSHSDFLDQYQSYRERDIELYLSQTRDQDEVREAGAEFLRATIRALKYSGFNHQTRTELLSLGAEALVLGSSDYLLLSYYAGVLNDGTKEIHDTLVAFLQRTRDTFDPKQYPASVDVRFLTTMRYVLEDGPGALPEARSAAFYDAVARWIADESARPDEARLTLRRLDHVMSAPGCRWDEVLHRLLPRSGIDPWLLNIVAARTYNTQGWAARGNGLGSTVTPEGWRRFEISQRRAGDFYRTAWLLRPDRPEPAAHMISIAGSIDEFGTPADWFEKAIAAEFDFPGAYSALMGRLLPRWGGSRLRMIQFGKACYLTGRFDTTVPLQFLEVFSALHRQEGIATPELSDKIPGLEEASVEFVRALQAAEQGLRSDELHAWRVGHEGYPILIEFLSLTRQPDLARALAVEIPADRRVPHFYKRTRQGGFELSVIRATSSASQSRVDKLLTSLYRAPLGPISEEESQSLRAELAAFRDEGDVHAVPFLDRCAALLNQRLAWNRGDWIEFDPLSDDLTLEYEATYTRPVPGYPMLELIGNEYDTVQLGAGFLLPFHFPLEIEALVDSHPSGTSGLEGAGIQWNAPLGVGRPRGRVANLASIELPHPFVGYAKDRFVGYANDRGHGFLLPRNQTGRYFEYAPAEPTPSLVRWKVWPDSYEFVCNGTIMSGDFLTEPDPEGRLWVGEPHSIEALPYAQVTHGRLWLGPIRIRALKVPAPPLRSAPFDQRVEYWRARSAADPDEAVARFELASLLLESQPETVPGMVDQLRKNRPGLRGLDVLQARAWIQLKQYDRAESALRRAIAAQDSLVSAISDLMRLGVLRDGGSSPLLKELDRIRVDRPGTEPETWRLEMNALRVWAETEQQAQRPQASALLRSGGVKEAIRLMAQAVAIASPGPRRDRLSAQLAHWEQQRLESPVVNP